MSGSSAGDLVSVVIATYNMGRYLPEAVQSVLGQSYANVDLQIVDDGSTDDTPAILRRWDGHPRVRLYSQANAGKARAMNQGVALSGGSFIAFLDADDVWLPEKLSRQMPLFAARSEVGVVYSDYERMDGAGARSEEHTSELQSHVNLVCRLLLEKKKKKKKLNMTEDIKKE